jgi:hypothetical protein
MRQCYLCNWHNGHGLGCPDSLSGSNRSAAQAEYREGWNAGRSGEDFPNINNHTPAYNMGFNNGMCALEAAENGE